MANSMEHLTDFVFVNMANTILPRRDSYLSYLKAGVKADTCNAFRTALLHFDTIFLDSVIKQERILTPMTKIALGWCTRSVGTTHMNRKKRGPIAKNRTDLLGKTSLVAGIDRAKENNSTHHYQPRASSRINDNA